MNRSRTILGVVLALFAGAVFWGFQSGAIRWVGTGQELKETTAVEAPRPAPDPRMPGPIAIAPTAVVASAPIEEGEAPEAGPDEMGAAVAALEARAQAERSAAAREAEEAAPTPEPAAAPPPVAAAKSEPQNEPKKAPEPERAVVVPVKADVTPPAPKMAAKAERAIPREQTPSVDPVALRIVHRPKLEAPIVLEEVTYTLDGQQIFARAFPDTGKYEKPEVIAVFAGSLKPGAHEIHVSMRCRLADYGLFTYAKGYKIKLSSSHNFRVEPGRPLELSVIPFTDSVTKKATDRLQIRFEERAKEPSRRM